MEVDAVKLYKKNNTATDTYFRKGLQDLKVLATNVHKELTEHKNAKYYL
ncbi:histone H1 [Pedobacter cryoconitis]|nr:histone H1 [Pedobacter cryoconitis]